MTTEELKQELERRESINAQLAALISDEEQLASAQASLADVEVSQLQVTLDLPSGEAMVAFITAKDGTKLRFSTESPSADMLEAMIAAGLAHAQASLAERRAELLEQL